MQHERNPHRTLDLVYQQLDQMTDQVETNMQIYRRSQERELELLRAADLNALFRAMTTYLRESYGLLSVTVVIADPDHEIRHLLQAVTGDAGPLPDVHFVESLTGITPHYNALRAPWTGPFNAADHQLLFPGGGEIGSIAVIPLIHQRALFGSINFASPDAGRFTRQHATDFLAHLGVIATFALENVVNRARLLRSGFTDVLTGWHNRRYLQLRLTEELARAARDSSRLVALMIDIDHFKRVNDIHGHAAGDRVLRALGAVLLADLRTTDVPIRWGGEELVLLLPHTVLAEAAALAERLRFVVEHDVAIAPRITISGGVAEWRRGETVEEVVERADKELYEAKASGRNRVCIARDNRPTIEE